MRVTADTNEVRTTVTSQKGKAREDRPFRQYLHILSYVTSYRWFLALIIVLIMVDVAFSVGGAWAQQLYVDTIVAHDLDRLTRLSLICASVVIVCIGFLFIQGVMSKYLEESVRVRLNSLVFNRMNQMPLTTIQSYHSGDLTSIGTNDVRRVSSVISGVTLQIIRNVILALVSFIYLVNINVFLASLVLISGPLIFFSGRFFDRKLRVISADVQASRGVVRGVLQENFQGLRSVKALGLQEWFKQRFLEQKTIENRLVRRSTTYSIWMSESSSVVNNLLTIFIVFFICMIAIRGDLTVGSILAFMSLMGRVQIPFVNLSRNWGQLQEGIGAGRKVLAILDSTDEEQQRKTVADGAVTDGAVTDKQAAGALQDSGVKSDKLAKKAKQDVEVAVASAIEFHAVSFIGHTDQGEHHILQDIHLHVKHGEMVAIVGASGAGKTTLSRVICRLYDPSSGEIRMFGHSIYPSQTTDVHSLIAYVPQLPFILPGTIRDNITFGMEGVSEEQIIEATQLAHAHEFIEKLEEGLDTVMTESGSTISGGQKQRIMIARAFLRDTPIIVMDEPTSALDHRSDQLIHRAIDSMRGKKTIIIVAHKLQTIASADQILVMSGGRIVESGSHVELMGRSDSEYRRMVDKQYALGTTKL